MDMVCTIKTISLQLNPMDQGVLAKESSKDPVIARVMCYTREGWPPQLRSEGDSSVDCLVETFRKLSVSLSTIHGCLLLGSRVVIPPSLRAKVLQLLHLGHFGMQRMKLNSWLAQRYTGLRSTLILWISAITAQSVLNTRTNHQSLQTNPGEVAISLPETSCSHTDSLQPATPGLLQSVL